MKQTQKNMNTQTKTSATGKIYNVSTSFKVGDKVAIHNKITGEISYYGVIKHYSYERGHFAVISVPGGVRENALGSALIIN